MAASFYSRVKAASARTPSWFLPPGHFSGAARIAPTLVYPAWAQHPF
jgi:hypothetical protein